MPTIEQGCVGGPFNISLLDGYSELEVGSKRGNLSSLGLSSDTDEIGFKCHLLPNFNPDTNANADLIGYQYNTDSSNPDI